MVSGILGAVEILFNFVLVHFIIEITRSFILLLIETAFEVINIISTHVSRLNVALVELLLGRDMY